MRWVGIQVGGKGGGGLCEVKGGWGGGLGWGGGRRGGGGSGAFGLGVREAPARYSAHYERVPRVSAAPARSPAWR